jgi:hypothetical protein
MASAALVADVNARASLPSPWRRRRSAGCRATSCAIVSSLSPAAMPSERKTSVPGFVPFSAAFTACTARVRSGTSGTGAAACSLSRAFVAAPGMASFVRFAVKATRTGVSLASASPISASAVWTRRSQSAALAQPLSISRTSGPPWFSVLLRGLKTGSAIARITAAAISMRSSVSHQGLCAGVSSRLSTVARIFSGGKTSACGRGGVRRSSHQMTGRAIRAPRMAG